MKLCFIIVRNIRWPSSSRRPTVGLVPGLVLAGLLTGLSLIVAIGAQNAFVLRQGLTRTHVGVVVGICVAGDLLLITAGVAGVGVVVAAHPTALTVMRWAGAAYLIWFGLRSLWAARTPHALDARSASAKSVALTILALTFLNPHVYLDTVLMLGNVANQHGNQGRWWFALGAGIASTVWFTGLGFGAGRASRLVSSTLTWRVLDVVIGLTMIGIAALLVLG